MRQTAPILCFLFVNLCMAQAQKAPNLDAQRAAMKKLEFLVGKWSGEARILPPGSTEPTVVVQTEDAQYRLDGLVLVIEGAGHTKDGKPALQALGIVTYDDGTGTYRMRAFNDGRFLETEVKLLENGKGFTWGFALGQVKTNSVMRISDKGDWTELTEITIGTQPPRKYMELSVSPQK